MHQSKASPDFPASNLLATVMILIGGVAELVAFASQGLVDFLLVVCMYAYMHVCMYSTYIQYRIVEVLMSK